MRRRSVAAGVTARTPKHVETCFSHTR